MTITKRSRLDEELKDRLLGSIAAGRLVVFCGAGVSMASPTNLPSAAALASLCAHRYEQVTGTPPAPALYSDLEGLARLLYRQGQLKSLLVARLVDWGCFRDNPNEAHTAIADLLLCGSLGIVISTNYDTHIESAAARLGERDFCPALDGDDLVRQPVRHGPLLKLHGCCYIDRQNVVWLPEQLTEHVISQRIRRSRTWASANLRHKDFLFVGLWSDWSYLNEILQDLLDGIDRTDPMLAVLVDPASAKDLAGKAPSLWQWATTSPQIDFQHIQERGEIFLDELRVQVARQFVRHTLATSTDTYTDLAGEPPPAVPTLDTLKGSDALYQLRRDMTGVGSHGTVTTRSVSGLQVLGAIQRRLLALGAIQHGPIFQLGDHTFRIVLGSGKLLSHVRQMYQVGSPTIALVDTIVCVGATSDPTPPNLVRPVRVPTVIRPSPAREWVTEDEIQDLWVAA